MLNINSPEIVSFLTRWHEAERARYNAGSPDWPTDHHMHYDNYYPKSAKDGKRWIKLDRGNEHNRSGVYVVDKTTHEVFTVQGYGVPNKRHPQGRIETMFCTKVPGAGEPFRTVTHTVTE